LRFLFGISICQCSCLSPRKIYFCEPRAKKPAKLLLFFDMTKFFGRKMHFLVIF